ncbi:MAG: immunoglobulin domain-containing protein [Verrucomicrobia bacterium]|nr:immunoglobulin domain-containing protein [Verrucomicrobiota bacterium]
MRPPVVAVPPGLRPSGWIYAVLLLVAAAGPSLAQQFAWSVFDEATLASVPVTAGRVTVTVPAGQRVTLITTNFVPLDLTASTAAPLAVTVTFTASGGLSNLASGQRAVGFGLFNQAGTAGSFIDDPGYFAWVNGRSTGSLLELRRRNGDGPSPSLLAPTGASVSNLGTGGATQTAGALTDGVPYAITLRLNRSSAGISLGTGTATDAAGVWLRGDGLGQTAYTNPDTPPAATLFNALAFMFQNTTAAPVTLSLDAVSGLTVQASPTIVAQPQQLILGTGQSGTLTVTATGTPPLTYEWRRDGVPIGGGNGPSFTTNVAGSYSVVVTNSFGSAVSAAATVTISAVPVPVTIDTQPVSQAVNAGQPVTFSVNAFGSAPLTFEWQKNSIAVPGGNGPTLTIASAGPEDAGVYSVVVRNATSSVVSQPAVLTVNAPPSITVQPVGVLVNLGDRAQFTVGVAAGNSSPSYQWLRNGAPIAGATNAIYVIGAVAAGDLGSYAVRVSNGSGSVLSSAAVLTAPSTMRVMTRQPATGAATVIPDTPLRLTFDREVRVGASGRIRIHRAADGQVVDTLDLGAAATRLIGTNPTPYAFRPALASGNTLTIFPRAGVLAYGQTYAVTVESGAVLDATGATFPGIADPMEWRFSTRNAGPLPGTAALTVAADGSGDFMTVQGAIDFVPAGNTSRVVITVRRGTYSEMVYLGATKPLITIRGEDRAQTVIEYANNASFNAGNNRALFACDAADFVLETITVRNTTPRGGSQAEALRGNGQRAVLNRVTLSSYQDTLLWNGGLFVTDSLIEGDVDFMWGGGAAFFQRCELRSLGSGYLAQVRNSQTGKGHVYVDCRLTAPAGVNNVYLARIDPREGVANTWPFSQVVLLNCALGAHLAREGWRLDGGATSAPNVQFWEYQSTDLDGATLDIGGRLRDSRQISDAVAAQYRDPKFVVGFAPAIAPAIETPPTAQTVLAGSNARLSVVATGAPAPSYQWLRGGSPISGATAATLVLAGVRPEDAGEYSVRVTNGSGSISSAAAALSVARGPWAGTYAGTLGGGGVFALYVRDDGSAVFLSRSGGFAGTQAMRSAFVNEKGQVSARVGNVVVEAVISVTGAISGSVGPDPRSGIAAPSVELRGQRDAAAGAAQAFGGYHQLRQAGGSLVVDVIVAAGGSAMAVVAEAGGDAGTGTVDAAGRLTAVTTGGRSVSGVLGTGAAAGTATVVTTQAGGNRITTLLAAADAGARSRRITGLATRARAGAGDRAAIVGFVISGDAPRAVVVRGIGPALAALGVGGALAAPRLELFRGSQLVAANAGWAANGNTTTLAAAFSRVGLFALDPAGADAALAMTLAPGAYTAQITGAGGAEGNALVEIYDLAPGDSAQRLSNLSTRAFAGTGDATLIGGMTVAGEAPKRVLVRAIGPSLGGFGVAGFLARPVLTLFQGDRAVAQNGNWTTSADAAAITQAAVEVGAFPLAPGPGGTADAALLISLMPGNYTAQVVGAEGGTGVALLEIYEVP